MRGRGGISGEASGLSLTAVLSSVLRVCLRGSGGVHSVATVTCVKALEQEQAQQEEPILRQ